MNKIKVFDVNRMNSDYLNEYIDLFKSFVTSGYYIMGDKVREFEKKFAEYLGVKKVITTANCGDALVLSLKALGIGFGDEVLVPVNTYIATAFAVSWVGGIPIFVDIDKDTHTIDINDAKEKITKKTKAIIPVHLYGYPVDMDELLEFSYDYGLKVVEDCAQSTNARYKQKKTGTFGITGCFSFFPTKNLGCLGDGGCISTNDEELADTLSKMRNYGMIKSHEHLVKGINSRFDELQAGFLLIKLAKLEEEMKVRKRIAKRYLSEIANEHVELPYEGPSHIDHAWHLFVVKVKNRQKFISYMNDHNIEVLIHYPKLITQQTAYSEFNKQRFPVAESTNKEIASIPIHQKLNEDEVNYIIDVINKYRI